MNINQAFLLQGDTARNSAILLPELLNAGIRLLVYAGNAGALLIILSSHNEKIKYLPLQSRLHVQLYG